MRIYVLTVDQRRSRRGRDLVDDALAQMRRLVPQPLLPFERTAGDEFQGVVTDAEDVRRASLTLMRDGSWSVGIGVGEAEEPLPSSTAGTAATRTVAVTEARSARRSTSHQSAAATTAAAPRRTTAA
jgi:hypothetical protein